MLETDRATVGQLLDLPLTSRVVEEDSILTYFGASPTLPGGISFGQISDENFGTTRQSVYLTPRLPTGTANLTVIPPFSSKPLVKLDSIVVIIPIDTLRGFYGPGRDFPVTVNEITNSISRSQDRYSDFTTAVEAENIAVDANLRPTLTPSEVRDTIITGREFKRAHVRIRLSDAFVKRIDELPAAAYDTDSVFRENFAGILVAPTGDSEALLNLLPSGLAGDTPYSGFNCYYRDSTGLAREYRISFGQALPNYTTDLAGSLAEQLVDGSGDNSLLAVAGRGGLMSAFTFTDLSILQGRVINRAVLEIPVAEVEGVDYGAFGLPPRVELFYRSTTDNRLTLIEDRASLRGAGNTAQNVNLFLGGNLITDDGLRYYDPAFTLHLKRMVDGVVPPTIYLRVFPVDPGSPQSTARAFLNGPTAAEAPARVRVTFTELGG